MSRGSHQQKFRSLYGFVYPNSCAKMFHELRRSLSSSSLPKVLREDLDPSDLQEKVIVAHTLCCTRTYLHTHLLATIMSRIVGPTLCEYSNTPKEPQLRGGRRPKSTLPGPEWALLWGVYWGAYTF